MTISNNIHILGAGSVGGLVAHELLALRNPPTVTLLMRNALRLEHFTSINYSSISINRVFKTPAESCPAKKVDAGIHTSIKGDISNLIITTKTYQTEEALKPYLQFIKPSTNILLIQNGLGVVEELYDNVWPEVSQRPNIFQGVISHGAYITSTDGESYQIVHSGPGDLIMARVPKDFGVSSTEDSQGASEFPAMIQDLTRAAELNAKTMSYPELLVIQLRKFLVNCCMNSITSIVDCINGELNPLPQTRVLFKDISDEALNIFFKTMPILSEIKDIEKTLNSESLVDYVVEIGTVIVGKNSSSMRQDTLNKRDTEIDYINGHLVKLAHTKNLPAKTNETITNLVKLRTQLNQHRR